MQDTRGVILRLDLHYWHRIAILMADLLTVDFIHLLTFWVLITFQRILTIETSDQNEYLLNIITCGKGTKLGGKFMVEGKIVEGNWW